MRDFVLNAVINGSKFEALEAYKRGASRGFVGGETVSIFKKLKKKRKNCVRKISVRSLNFLLLLLLPPLLQFPRFSESLSVNNLSFRFWFLGLFFFYNEQLPNLGLCESQVFSESRSRNCVFFSISFISSFL